MDMNTSSDGGEYVCLDGPLSRYHDWVSGEGLMTSTSLPGLGPSISYHIMISLAFFLIITSTTNLNTRSQRGGRGTRVETRRRAFRRSVWVGQSRAQPAARIGLEGCRPQGHPVQYGTGLLHYEAGQGRAGHGMHGM